MLEARTTSQLHVFSELAKGSQIEENEIFSEKNTLHSDGTSKKGHSYFIHS